MYNLIMNVDVCLETEMKLVLYNFNLSDKYTTKGVVWKWMDDISA